MVTFVLDTNIWLDILLFNDPSVKKLSNLIFKKEILVLSCKQCDDEFSRVLKYKNLGIEKEKQNYMLRTYKEFVKNIDFVETLNSSNIPKCHDSDDQKFVNLSCINHVDWLLTKDKQILKMKKKLGKMKVKVSTVENWISQFNNNLY